MTARRSDTTRMLLIASTVVSGLLLIVFGIPRVRALATPSLTGVRVVSAALGDVAPRGRPHSVLVGVPVTLYALVEALPFGTETPRLYGPVEWVSLGSEDTELTAVEPWSPWWYSLEILWFKVEPVHGFANDSFDPDFQLDELAYQDSFMTAWGFSPSHAADIRPTADAFPRIPVGTMRFSAQAVVRDHRDRILGRAIAAGAESILASGAAAPHRVTVTAGTDPLGQLQGFAGLPYVPFVGRVVAAQHPAAGRIGGTVLDYWITANRELRSRSLPYFSWEELSNHADLLVDDMFLANDGTYYYSNDPLRPVTFDRVRPGDIVAIDDHIGVLFEDRGPGGGGDGLLNRWDRVLEAYFEPLRDSMMGDAFIADISVLRLRVDDARDGVAP